MEAKEAQKRVNEFSEACRRFGVKATHQRKEVYRELAGTNEHPDAETIYRKVRKRIPEISLDTVYRTLHLLEKKGLIARVGFLGDKTRFDANTDRHHHFVCTECGYMGDVYHEEWNDFRGRGDVQAMGTVNSIYVELRGLCRACQAKRHEKKE
jgi:Fur family transcriptional regulator, peroxide stress response regulator